MHLAFITSSNFNLIPEGEKICFERLNPAITYELLVWDQVDQSKLASFDRIFLRTCWDYHLKFTEFNQWLGNIERSRIPVTNPLQGIRWNSKKTYLFDLKKAGLPIVPTYTTSQIQKILSDFPETESFVIKPILSASAYQLRKVYRKDLMPLIHDKANIIQPFMPEIEDNGEWSLMFFKSEYSHAVLKTAKPGDFRVQSDFGGAVHHKVPSADLLALAKKTIDKLPVPIDYCRIDLLKTKNSCLIMEVEIIEPELFINTQEAVDNYQKFILRLGV